MNNTRRTQLLIAAAIISLGIGTTVAHPVLPTGGLTDVPFGTLAGATPLDVLSVDAFTRAINQSHGTTAVLQHVHFAPGQSTGWHTHPGPNAVVVMAGSLTLIDERCMETQYAAGKGLVTGLGLHEAIAGPDGADVYGFYFLPADAQDLRADASGPLCARR